MSEERFVVIERDQRDDDPDEILNVWVFSTETEALGHAQGMSERDEACWNARAEWSKNFARFRGQWFDAIVRPHIYGPAEDAARARLREMAIKELGPEPTLDGACGTLDVFRCIPGGSGKHIWPSSSEEPT